MEQTDATTIKRPKPVVMVILDGWGINQPYPGNAITQANTPVMDKLIAEYPSTTLKASGESVGLPWGESGNSEVGHLNLGLGRILYQDLPRINKSINDRTFYENPVLKEAIGHVKKHGSALHLLGVVSSGCVHASIDHLHALLVLARENDIKNVFIHAILDGRDTPYNSGLNFVRGIILSMIENNTGAIATLSGRFYAMDRNNNWDRTAKAYSALTAGAGVKAEDPVAAIEKSYKHKIYDEEFPPVVITKNGEPIGLVKENDAVIFYNYRPDRARQLTKAFVGADFDKFGRPEVIKNLYFAIFTEYEKDLPAHVVFPPEPVDNSLGEVLAAAGLKQLRISETEKYAHVTYFFNGGRETKSVGEDHALIPSLPIDSYDKKPEMSGEELAKTLVNAVNGEKYDFILVNYPNCDMVGHTGNLEAAIKAIEFLDLAVDKIVKAVLNKGGAVLITADHGNADMMFNMENGEIDKEHTANPVPFIVVGEKYAGKNFNWPNVVGSDLSLVQPQGILSDIAPTILKILGLPQPREMTGRSLF